MQLKDKFNLPPKPTSINSMKFSGTNASWLFQISYTLMILIFGRIFPILPPAFFASLFCPVLFLLEHIYTALALARKKLVFLPLCVLLLFIPKIHFSYGSNWGLALNCWSVDSHELWNIFYAISCTEFYCESLYLPLISNISSPDSMLVCCYFFLIGELFAHDFYTWC